MKTTLQGIEDTLYIPLLGRIYVSKNLPELLYDKKALELEKHIPSDKINANNNEYIYIAGANRYYVLDKEVRQFIGKHKNANIVNLGAGLETMYQRIFSKNTKKEENKSK